MIDIVKYILYGIFLIVVSAAGVEILGGNFFVTDGRHIYLNKERFFVREPDLGYALRPNFHMDGVKNKLYPGVTVTIGSHGLRMPEFDSRPKIVIVGDSVAFGFGLSYEETIASQLEMSLNGKYQIINAGVPGYNTGQWQSMGLNLVEKVKPKAVIALVNANDFETIYYPIRGGASVSRTKSYPWETELPIESKIPHEDLDKSIIKWIIDHPNITEATFNGLNPPPIMKGIVRDDSCNTLIETEMKSIKYFNSNTVEMKEKRDNELLAMNQFSERLSKLGVDVIFAFFPFRVSSTQPLVGADARFNFMEDNIKNGPGVGIVRLQNRLTNIKYYLPCDSHTNSLGNAEIAKVLLEKMQAMQKTQY
jgi:hypothetical protein